MSDVLSERIRKIISKNYVTDCELLKGIHGIDCEKFKGCSECRRAAMIIVLDAIDEASSAKCLPDGIEWPRFEDGRLVKFGDRYVNANGNASEVGFMCIKPEGFKIGHGQTKNKWQKWGEPVKRLEPDTQEEIDDDATLPPLEYCNRRNLLGVDSAYFDEAEAIEAMCKDLLERQRKLLIGGAK